MLDAFDTIEIWMVVRKKLKQDVQDVQDIYFLNGKFAY
jgi:hypothetical protein